MAQPTLAQQRCFNHPAREAVARCPECARHFCRECITEHDDRVVCSACLHKLTRKPERRRYRLGPLVKCVQFGLGIVLTWLFFYFVGQGLAQLPSAFHSSTVWQTSAAAGK